MNHVWLFAFVTGILGCNEVVPGTCRPNTTGGAGGAGDMPIGAGVGATTTGTYGADPPKGPLASGDGADGSGDEPPRQPQGTSNPPDPCEDPEFGKPATAYIDCRKRGLSADLCSQVC